MSCKILGRAVFGGAGLVLLALGTAGHAGAATFTVQCPSQKLSTAISSAFATATIGTAHTFNVSGTCSDHVVVPPGAIITINGATGARLTGDTTATVLANWGGQVFVNNMRISTTYAAGEVLIVGNGGWLGLVGSTIASSTANATLRVMTSGSAMIENSSITNGKGTTVDIVPLGYLWVSATNGKTTTMTYTGTEGGQVIGCWGGAFGAATSGTGKITIGPSKGSGIQSRGCHGSIGSDSSTKESVRITGAVGNGVNASGGDSYEFTNMKIDGIGDRTIQMLGSWAAIRNSTIVTKTYAVRAGQNGTIYFSNGGTNSVSGTATPYNCYQGGKMYADVNPAGGGTSPNGCLTIGGAGTH